MGSGYPASADDGNSEEPDNKFPAIHSAPFYSRMAPTVNMGGSDAMYATVFANQCFKHFAFARYDSFVPSSFFQLLFSLSMAG